MMRTTVLSVVVWSMLATSSALAQTQASDTSRVRAAYAKVAAWPALSAHALAWSCLAFFGPVPLVNADRIGNNRGDAMPPLREGDLGDRRVR